MLLIFILTIVAVKIKVSTLLPSQQNLRRNFILPSFFYLRQNLFRDTNHQQYNHTPFLQQLPGNVGTRSHPRSICRCVLFFSCLYRYQCKTFLHRSAGFNWPLVSRWRYTFRIFFLNDLTEKVERASPKPCRTYKKTYCMRGSIRFGHSGFALIFYQSKAPSVAPCFRDASAAHSSAELILRRKWNWICLLRGNPAMMHWGW